MKKTVTRTTFQKVAKRAGRAGLVFVLLLGMALLFASCGGGAADYDPLEGVETITFHDDCGRDVEIPKTITRVAPSGAVSQMVLLTIAPEAMVGLSATPSLDQRDFIPQDMWTLPTFGQFYGSKATMNMESLIAAQPQVIIDIGDKKLSHKSDMDKIQKQTGIPTIFIQTTLDKMPGAYRTLGQLFGKEEKGNELADYIESTVAYAQDKAGQIPDQDRKTVYYGTGTAGLDCNADGSVQADVIDIIGAKNAVVGEDVSDKGGGTLINMEKLYVFDPDVIIVTSGGVYRVIDEGDTQWAELSAVKEGAYYEIPGIPYCWMSGPPSVNRILGIWWLGQLVYPEQYGDYDMVEKAQEYYKMFFNYDLTEGQAKEMLAHSTEKTRNQ